MKYFVTGTGTDIGKTYVTSLLMKQNGWTAMKPVASGGDDAKILGCKPLYQLKEPIAPHIAARNENVHMEFAKIISHCHGYDLVEGAGGVMSPMTETHTNLDLIKALGAPAILVTGTHLGTISHTLTALAVMKDLHVTVVLNETQASRENELADISAIIRKLSGNEVIVLRRNQMECAIR